MASKSIYSEEQRILVGLLRQLREEAGLRQVELAERLNRHQSFVSKYEAGQRRLDLIELRAVAGVLGVSLGELVRRFERAVGG